MLSAIHCFTSGDDSRKIAEVYESIHDWKEPIPVSAVQYSAQQKKNYKYINQQMIPFPITRNSSRDKHECNWIITLTSGFFQIKIENICLLKLIKKTRKRL